MTYDIDFGKTAKDYSTHRKGFPTAIISRLQEIGVGTSPSSVLDIGTGTGTLARLFAEAGHKVTGLDPSPDLIAEAKILDQKAGVCIEYRAGKAEKTGLPNQSFDIVCAGQCWHWFDAVKACTEIKRILKPKGWIIIAHFDWIPLQGNMVEATENLIRAHNPSWDMHSGTGTYPQWYKDLGNAGFSNLQSFSQDLEVSYSPEAWRGRIRASAGVAASLPEERVTAFDQELASRLKTDFPENPLQVPHRLWVLVGRAPLRER